MALIQIRSLTKLYTMGESVVRALDGVDLDIEAGEFIAITGASGSGKSTMMHLLGCLDRPTSGSYVFNGRDVSRMSDRELAAIRNREIGFVFQTFNLINRTSAMDNVGVPLFYARKINTSAPARRALERVGLGHRYGHRPNELSGGERQRVAIARAIVNEPLLVLADEPTGNLDTRTGEQIMQIFHDLNAQGVTIILVTHEADIAAQARRVVQMRDGRIVADGPPPGGGLTQRSAERDGVSAVSPRADEVRAAPLLAPARSSDSHAESPDAAPVSAAATRALWLGGIAVAIALVAFATAYYAAAQMPKNLKPNTMPPLPVVFAGLGALLGFFGAMVVGLIAVFRGWFAVKSIRKAEPPATGTARAYVGMALGGLGTVLPLLPFVASLLKTKVSA